MPEFADAESIARRIIETHKPHIAELDQDGGSTGQVCHEHGMGYAPSWPCSLLVLATALIEARQGVSDLAAMTPMLAENSAQKAIDHVLGHLFEQDPRTGHLRLKGGATEVSEGVMRKLIREAVDGST